MGKLDSSQIERLKEFEKAMRNAVKNDFVHLSSSEFNKIAEVYNEVFTPLRKSQMACNTCRLKALKQLGELYYSTMEKGEKSEKGEKVESKKKGGRPKKIAEE